MLAKEVLNLLRISRPTLTKYVKTGLIRVEVKPNSRYDYNKEDVFKLFNKGVERKNYIYGRVSTHKQEQDLINQIEVLKQFCFSKGIRVDGVYRDIASGVSFNKRKDFFKLLEEIIDKRVENVIILYKDRLSRVGFELLSELFNYLHTNIIVVSEVGSEKLDSQEMLEELVSFLNCYPMQLHLSKKTQVIQSLLKKEDP